MVTTTLSRPELADPEFAGRWRDFAERCGASFFQDWTWLGRLAAERYHDPVLAEARQDGRLVALALFNRRRTQPWGETFYLHESGIAQWDAVFIEHNGPLVLGSDKAAKSKILDAAMGGTRRLVLSGVDAETRAAAAGARGRIFLQTERSAPYVDLARLQADSAFIDTLSRNTRHQLRRSNRGYEGRGPLGVRRAETVEEALRHFDALVSLHEATWRGRGSSGAFAGSEVRRFHHALITEGVPRGEVDLLRIAAGSDTVGYLMNFVHRGVVSAYQSGFDYVSAGPHQKPGLTSHYLAIEAARAAGATEYDFLAGPSRYKTSFANADRPLFWLSIAGAAHPFALRERIKQGARKICGVQSNKS